MVISDLDDGDQKTLPPPLPRVTFLWLLSTDGVTKAFSHRSHLYFLWPSCTTWMCTLSVSFLLKVASHWSHLKGGGRGVLLPANNNSNNNITHSERLTQLQRRRRSSTKEPTTGLVLVLVQQNRQTESLSVELLFVTAENTVSCSLWRCRENGVRNNALHSSHWKGRSSERLKERLQISQVYGRFSGGAHREGGEPGRGRGHGEEGAGPAHLSV
ncbi:hypothetical protein EYF80_056863 [Liparis tanakae]|uniref:Uncharacterized protein n=1 Tax=Liparis tanakae TaxID=230148 RepID=A0A4Z2EWM2_9TELE|nr:hypothetical protein EYF80_056863 [Liparis tanakae]